VFYSGIYDAFQCERITTGGKALKSFSFIKEWHEKREMIFIL
jgi:hypothetical protein